jgi:hypothetical protein
VSAGKAGPHFLRERWFGAGSHDAGAAATFVPDGRSRPFAETATASVHADWDVSRRLRRSRKIALRSDGKVGHDAGADVNRGGSPPLHICVPEVFSHALWPRRPAGLFFAVSFAVGHEATGARIVDRQF